MSGLTRKKKIAITSISVSLVLILTATMLILYFTIGHSFNKNINPPIDGAAFINESELRITLSIKADDGAIDEIISTPA